MRRRWLVLVLLGTGTHVYAEQVQIRSDRTVSIEMTGIPLRDALQAIAKSVPFEKLVLDDAVAERAVTLKLDAVNLPQALAAILASADVNYVVAGGDDGQPIRLVAGRATFVAANVKSARRDVVRDATAAESRTDASDATQGPAPADEATAAAGAAAFETALTAPVPPVRPGTRVALPFPGADGMPLTTTMPAVRPTLLPFPTLPPPTVPASPAPARPQGSTPDR